MLVGTIFGCWLGYSRMDVVDLEFTSPSLDGGLDWALGPVRRVRETFFITGPNSTWFWAELEFTSHCRDKHSNQSQAITSFTSKSLLWEHASPNEFLPPLQAMEAFWEDILAWTKFICKEEVLDNFPSNYGNLGQVTISSTLRRAHHAYSISPHETEIIWKYICW